MSHDARVFVDTGPIAGKFNLRDPYHETASELFARLDERRVRYVTSTLVLSEAITMLGFHVGHEAASKVGHAILDSAQWIVVRPELATDLEALGWFTKFDDQEGLSFCDCVSFAIMRRNKLQQAFSFDHHFDLAGFERMFLDDCP